jgi:hypothetical protein
LKKGSHRWRFWRVRKLDGQVEEFWVCEDYGCQARSVERPQEQIEMFLDSQFWKVRRLREVQFGPPSRRVTVLKNVK